ncbi:MAG: HemK/PrmC family methyltransferase [bacterium]|nr:HemK/PrmC family methyltransferase [bacterium]
MKNTIQEWLIRANKKLTQAQIPSANLDAELILSKVLSRERTYLHAKPDKKLTKQQIFHANNWLNLRAKRVPLAYIFQEKEFYGRNFFVNNSVLVPRPETETLIDCIKNLYIEGDIILDVGTGSGIIPISILAEFHKNFGDNKNLEVFASDISLSALAVANLNAKKILNQEIPLFESDLLEKIPQGILQKITILTANLPYVDQNWIDFSEENELNHEPQIALYAEDGGLDLYKKLFQQAQNLPSIKFLLIEADPDQFQDLEDVAKNHQFRLVQKQNYTLVFEKIK